MFESDLFGRKIKPVQEKCILFVLWFPISFTLYNHKAKTKYSEKLQ